MASAAAAKPPSSPPSAQAKSASNQVLVDGLNAVAASLIAQSGGASSQSQPNQVDDQGDDHASLVAIGKVCNHDNPSATHSAICPRPNSPP
jgi:hypothetical protein